MSNELKLEKLEDLLTIDEQKLKAPESRAVITKLKQLLKENDIDEEVLEKEAEEYPYVGVSVVGNKYVEIKFDLKTKAARISEVLIDPRDTRGKNYMAASKAVDKVKRLYKVQKEIV